MQLDGSKLGRLHGLILQAFNLMSFSQVLTFRLDITFGNLTGGILPFSDQVFQFLQEMNMQHTIEKVVFVIRDARPRDPAIVAFADSIGMAPRIWGPQLQGLVKQKPGFVDINTFRVRLAQLEAQICKIETSTKTGTGFLIGTDLIMTNYHVVADELEDAPNITCRFDYKKMDNVVSNGTVYKVVGTAEWLKKSSGVSQLDYNHSERDSPRPATELDFAVLKLEEPAADHPIGGKTAEPGAITRGYAQFADSDNITSSDLVIIAQHPSGAPMQLAFGNVFGFNEGRTRFRYDTTTEPGSSGSPCFDEKLNLIGLHHAGDPSYPEFDVFQYNQGIPIKAISAQFP